MRVLSPTVLAGALALAFLALPGGLTGQQSTTRGLVLGLHASGASLSIEGEEGNEAGGGGIFVGYGFNRRFTVFFQADGAQFDEQSAGDVVGDWTLGHFDVGVRFNFANSLRRWVPFLQGAVGRRNVNVQDPLVDGNQEEEVDLSGTALTFGGGVAFHLARAWSLEASLLFSGGEFSTLRVNNVSVSGFDEDATSTRFGLGIRWWP